MNYSQGQTVGWMLLFFCGAFQLWDVPFVNPRCPLENTKYGITKPYELIVPHQLGLYAHYAPYGWFYPHHCWPYPYSSLKRDRKCYHSVVKHWSLPHLAYPKIPWLYPPTRIFLCLSDSPKKPWESQHISTCSKALQKVCEVTIQGRSTEIQQLQRREQALTPAVRLLPPHGVPRNSQLVTDDAGMTSFFAYVFCKWIQMHFNEGKMDANWCETRINGCVGTADAFSTLINKFLSASGMFIWLIKTENFRETSK